MSEYSIAIKKLLYINYDPNNFYKGFDSNGEPKWLDYASNQKRKERVQEIINQAVTKKLPITQEFKTFAKNNSAVRIEDLDLFEDLELIDRSDISFKSKRPSDEVKYKNQFNNFKTIMDSKIGTSTVSMTKEQIKRLKQEEEKLRAKLLKETARLEEEEEDDNLTEFEKMQDNFIELMDDKLYTKGQQEELFNAIRLYDRISLDDLFVKIGGLTEPVTTEELITTTTPLEEEEEEVKPTVDTSAVTLSKEPDDIISEEEDLEQTTQVEEPVKVEQQSEAKSQFVKRYHPIALKLIFENSSNPKWDTKLESNVLSLELNPEEIRKMKEDIINEYGTKIYITEIKSDTLVELNEMIQCKFCYIRNFHLGPRAPMISMKTGDFEKIKQSADNINNNLGNTPLLNNLPSIIKSGEPVEQTEDEYDFINNYDELQRKRALGTSRIQYKTKPVRSYINGIPTTTSDNWKNKRKIY